MNRGPRRTLTFLALLHCHTLGAPTVEAQPDQDRGKATPKKGAPARRPRPKPVPADTALALEYQGASWRGTAGSLRQHGLEVKALGIVSPRTPEYQIRITNRDKAADLCELTPYGEVRLGFFGSSRYAPAMSPRDGHHRTSLRVYVGAKGKRMHRAHWRFVGPKTGRRW